MTDSPFAQKTDDGELLTLRYRLTQLRTTLMREAMRDISDTERKSILDNALAAEGSKVKVTL